MKRISYILIICMIITSLGMTSYAAGIYDELEPTSGSITTSTLSNVNPGDTITATLSIDKDSFDKIVAFDIVGALTNLEVVSCTYLPTNRPSQLFTSATEGNVIDVSGFFLPTEDAVTPSGNSFTLVRLTLKAESTGTAKISISDAFAKFDFGDDDSNSRRVEFNEISFTVKRVGGSGNGSGNSSSNNSGSVTVTDKDEQVTDKDDKNDNTTDDKNEQQVTPPVVDKEDDVWANPFDDVRDTDWYYSSVEYANKNNLMRGVTDTTFSPNTSVTRAMFVTVLYRMEGEPASSSSTFDDVGAGSYYEKAVAWASANGIVNGVSDTSFAPDNNITREQMAAIVYRYATFKKADLSVGENTNILSYDDFGDISEYAIPAFQYMVASGIMKGETESTLNPKNVSTRAQAATVFMRVMENISK